MGSPMFVVEGVGRGTFKPNYCCAPGPLDVQQVRKEARWWRAAAVAEGTALVCQRVRLETSTSSGKAHSAVWKTFDAALVLAGNKLASS